MNSSFDKFRNLFVLLLLCLIAISYHAVFCPPDVEKSLLYSPVLYMTIITFVVTFKKDFLSFKYFRLIVLFLLVSLFYGMVCDAFFDNKEYYRELRDMAIALVALCIGYNVKMTDRFFIAFFLLYGAILVFYSSASQISTNIGGFIITDDYKIPSKNAIGAMLASFVAASLPILISKKLKGVLQVGLIFLLLSAIVVLVTIRARASTMTVFFTILIFIIVVFRNRNIEYQKTKRNILIIGIVLLVLIPVLSVLFQTIGNYIYNSLFQNVEGDVTTGRMIRNRRALEFISEHLLYGRLGTNVTLDWVHNYFLRLLSDYGLLFGLPLIVSYVFFLIKIIRRFFSPKVLSFYSFGYWAVIPPIMLSFVEPLFPFSPGTAVFFSYVLLGYSLKYNAYEKYIASDSNLSVSR